MGHFPILAENGMQALKIVQRMKPELIILDIAMPEMDGYELCNRIKSNTETRDIPIIFISAFDAAEDIVKNYPSAKIYCVDSFRMSGAIGLLAYHAPSAK